MQSSAKMTPTQYERFAANELTDAMLGEAAELFSNNYGVWGEQEFAKPGSRVRLGKKRLQTNYLSGESAYVRVKIGDQLAGHAIASYWEGNDKKARVCWVIQLVVDSRFRRRGLAQGLLRELVTSDIDFYGIMGSHPAACLAAAKAFGGSLESVRLDVIEQNAADIMSASPVPYVRDAKPRGSVFDSEDRSGLVSAVDTQFFVDHEEPLRALADVRKDRKWPLGGLHDGLEFLLLVDARQRSQNALTPASGRSV